MAEKDKNNFVVNDKTYVKKPEIHYSYKFQPYVKDLGGSPGKNITQEDRNKRLRLENNVNAVRNVVKGLNNTFGKAISGAAAFYGGGWALNRLLHLNKPSILGQFFGRYVLPANTVDNISDGVELIFDPSTEGAIDLGSGIVLGRFKDLSKPIRQVGELVGQGANINNMKSGGQIRKMLNASGGPINLLRKRIYTNIEPFGYNDIGSRLYNGIILNKNEHSNFKGDYSDIERAPALYLTIDNIWGEYLHIPEKERRYSNGKYKIKNNGNGTFSLPFKSMEDIMLTVNSNNPLLWGLRGKAENSVVGEYDIYRGYDKNGDYLKYIDHWRINPYDIKKDKEYGLDNNSLLKWYFKGKDDASFGLGTPVEIQGKYYLDDIYNVKGKDRGGRYLPEVVITGNKKKKQGGKMNILEFLKNGSKIHIKEKNKGKFTKSAKAAGLSVQEHAKSVLNDPNATPLLKKRANFARNAAKWKHKEGGAVKALEGTKFNWGSAIGNLASNALLLGISTYMLNKKLSSDAEADKERYKSEAASKLQKDMQDERTKRFNILNAIKGTSDNPNAFGGEIFEKYFINLGDDEAIRNYNQSISDYNKMIDLQIRAKKAENTGNFLSSLGLLGVGLLANSAFNKNSSTNNSSSTNTNTLYNLNNVLSTPNLSNLYSISHDNNLVV